MNKHKLKKVMGSQGLIMAKTLFLILLISLLFGCSSSPFAQQYRQIDTMYKTNRLTEEQYLRSKRNIRQQEIEWNKTKSKRDQLIKEAAKKTLKEQKEESVPDGQ
jgi:cell division protein FtsL